MTVLDYAFLSTITEKADGTVIYADRCSISEDKLSKMGVTFKKIPRVFTRLKGGVRCMELNPYRKTVLADLTGYLKLLKEPKSEAATFPLF